MVLSQICLMHFPSSVQHSTHNPLTVGIPYRDANQRDAKHSVNRLCGHGYPQIPRVWPAPGIDSPGHAPQQGSPLARAARYNLRRPAAQPGYRVIVKPETPQACHNNSTTVGRGDAPVAHALPTKGDLL